eukprot:gene1530-15976_t
MNPKIPYQVYFGDICHISSYSADLGSIGGESGYHQVIVGDNVADNTWHDVVIIQEGKKVTVKLDEETKSMVAPGQFDRLDLDIMFYVGGIDRAEQKRHLDEWLPDTKNFKGCLSNVKFRSRDILHSARFKLLNTKIFGEVSFQCHSISYSPLSFTRSSSKILLQREKETDETVLAARVRTFEANGIIATMATTKGHVTLAIIGGKAFLNITFNQLIGPEKKISVSLGKLDNGDWHDIEITIMEKKNSAKLQVGGQTKVYNFQRHFELLKELGPFTKTVRLGGPTISHPGFVGCLQNIRLDGVNVTWDSLRPAQMNEISNSCIPKDLCFPSPCLNSGSCSQDHGQFYCKCPKSLFKGKLCEHSIYKRTCDEIKKAGNTTSGTYRISPNGVDSFNVYCDMSHELGPATVIQHNLPKDSRVADVAPLGSNYIYRIKYPTGKQSAVDVADASVSCRQFIRYDCFESKLLDSLRRYKSEHTRGGRWGSRNGILQTYWGGAKPGSKSCGCGMPDKRNCAADHHLDCNCDVGDRQWRNDEGYLTDKDSLPVTMVQFSIDQQKGRSQRSFFTVGQLECFGTAPLPTTTPVPTSSLTTPTITKKTSTVKTTKGTTKIHTEKTTPQKIIVSVFHSEMPTSTMMDSNSSSWNASYDTAPVSNQDDLFPKPYLVTIVVIGTLLCILLITLVGVLFKAKVSGLLFRKSCPPKPRVEIEEYDPRSSVISSDWEFRIGTSFPTSTPDESTTTSEEDMRVRTLEDVRGRRKYGRLGTWGSRTASAPTLGGRMRNSRISITDRRCASRHSAILGNANCNDRDDASSQPYETSSDSSKYTMKSTTNTSNSNSSRFSTCTEQGTASDCESLKDVKGARDELSADTLKRNARNEFEIDGRVDSMSQATNVHMPDVKYANFQSLGNRPEDPRFNGNVFVPGNYMKVNGLSVPLTSQDGVNKQYYPQVAPNSYTHRPHIRRIPQPMSHPEYGTHLQLMNTIGRCYYPSQIGRFMPVSKRPFTSDGMPFMQQTIQEVDVAEEEQDVETNLIEDTLPTRKNSGSHLLGNGTFRHELGSEYAGENQEGLALLRRQIIEKATTLDDAGNT